MDFKLLDMKKLLTIILTILLSAQLSAQGNNLQFSNVLTLSFESTGGAIDNQTITVPNGQVLKITSVLCSHTSNDNYNDKQALFFKESTRSNYTIIQTGRNSSSEHANDSFPVWLKSGSYDFYFDNRQNSGTGTAILSGIYFNIIP